MRLHPNEIYIEVAFDLQVTLMALFAESYVELKSLSEKHHRLLNSVTVSLVVLMK